MKSPKEILDALLKRFLPAIPHEKHRKYVESIITDRDKALIAVFSMLFMLDEYYTPRKNGLRPLTKNEFHHIMCEFTPSIAEDSGQPEWTKGELDTAWDFLTGKKECILTHGISKEDASREALKVFITTYLIPAIDGHWTDSKMRNDLYTMVDEAEKAYKEMEGELNDRAY